MEDRDIVELYLKRDETAISETAARYGSRLRGLAQGITGDRPTAEECENDTYLEAWDTIPPHEPRTYFYPFLARITRHIAIDCCRKRDRLKRKARLVELSAELAECLPAPGAPSADRVALADALNGFLGQLTPEKRNVFLRRYWFLDPLADISRRFGLSESKVKSMLFRMRQDLRAYLEKEGCPV